MLRASSQIGASGCMLQMRLSVLILFGRRLASIFNGFEHLLDDFGMQACAGVERHRHPESVLAVDPVTAL